MGIQAADALDEFPLLSILRIALNEFDPQHIPQQANMSKTSRFQNYHAEARTTDTRHP